MWMKSLEDSVKFDNLGVDKESQRTDLKMAGDGVVLNAVQPSVVLHHDDKQGALIANKDCNGSWEVCLVSVNQDIV